ncbi:MAG TPA: YegP family protein [Nannocystaceae bacterium]|nr:YegP family protein [Nannocystaceae bacterium]
MARFRICGSSFVMLEGSDGEVLLRTPPLSGAFACRSRILSIRLSALLERNYVRSSDGRGRHAFVLDAVDGGVLAASPVYRSEEELERAIESVRRGAPGAFVTHAPLGDHDFEDVDPMGLDADVVGDDAADEPWVPPGPDESE